MKTNKKTRIIPEEMDAFLHHPVDYKIVLQNLEDSLKDLSPAFTLEEADVENTDIELEETLCDSEKVFNIINNSSIPADIWVEVLNRLLSDISGTPYDIRIQNNNNI